MKRLLAIIVLVVVALLTTAAYRLLEPEWIVFRTAENLFYQKQFSAAIPYYEGLAAAGFKRAETYRNLGDAYMATGQLAKALSVYENLTRIDSTNRIPLLRLAYYFAISQEYNTSIDILKTLLRMNPDDRTAHIYLARVFTWSGRFDEAINEYHIAIGEKK